MSYGYGGRPNPFDQRDAPGPGGYGGGPAPRGPPAPFGSGPSPYGGGNRAPAMGRNNYGGSNVEMASLSQNAAGFGQNNATRILDECREIDNGISIIEGNLAQLTQLQTRSLDDADTSASSRTNRELEALSAQTMSLYRKLTDQVRKVKSNPESRTPMNAPQVGRVDRQLKQAIQKYQQVESQFRKRTQDQLARQYRIVRPGATEEEVRQAVDDTSGGQVFTQALMQSNRRGQAQAVLSSVQDRQRALQRIEQQMVELAQLFQDMDTLIVQQEAAVAQIEQKGEEVVENLDKGNEEIAVAVTTAKKTRKKKWICLGICVAIVVVIVVIVVIYMLVIHPPSSNNNKRSIDVSDIDLTGFLSKTVPISRVMRRMIEPNQAGAAGPIARFAPLNDRLVHPGA